jgi:hypothetical protein
MRPGLRTLGGLLGGGFFALRLVLLLKLLGRDDARDRPLRDHDLDVVVDLERDAAGCPGS